MCDLHVTRARLIRKAEFAVKEVDKDKQCAPFDQFFYGSVTVGERGQVVIPAKARRDYNIECGDQLLIMGHPTKHGLMVAKVDAIRSFLSQMIDDLKFIESQQRTDRIDEAYPAGTAEAIDGANVEEGK
jgi:AbrB family looped-hinge helix DNA binding protein